MRIPIVMTSTWLLVWRMSEARRIAASGVSAVMSVGKMMSPRLPNILQRKSGMVRSFAPFRREHTYLSATGAPRDGPLPAMKPSVYPWDRRRKLMSKKSWNLRAHAAYQEPRCRQVKADNAVLISPRSSSFCLGGEVSVIDADRYYCEVLDSGLWRNRWPNAQNC